MRVLRVRGHAKINLSLEVRYKRPDGYHELRSLMAKVALHDTLELQPAPEGVLELRCSRKDLSCGEDNLVVKAARLLQAEAGRPLGARLRLIKRIPVAAGLAGGSADGVAALKGLARLWRLKLSPSRLKALALQLGSDLPFCLDPAPAALAQGRGERLKPVQGLPRLPLLIAKPAISVSTPWAFKALAAPSAPKPGPDHTRRLIRAMHAGDWPAFREHSVNHLEPVTSQAHPVIHEIKEVMLRQGAIVSKMSGSGPSVWGVFQKKADAQRAAKILKRKGFFSEVTSFIH